MYILFNIFRVYYVLEKGLIELKKRQKFGYDFEILDCILGVVSLTGMKDEFKWIVFENFFNPPPGDRLIYFFQGLTSAKSSR